MKKRSNKTDWVVALHDGIFETPHWSSFLGHHERATDAEYASLVIWAPHSPFGDWIQSVSGGVSPELVEKFTLEYPPDRRAHSLTEGKPYALSDIPDDDNSDLRRELVEVRGISALRLMRVQEESGVSAFLSIARRGKDFTQTDVSFLREIAPVLRSVLRLFVAMERERFAASLSADAIQRLQFGWLTLDSAGHILGADQQGERMLAESGVLHRTPAGRLAARSARLERQIKQALGHMAENPNHRPRAFVLSRDPWLDMLLVPARRKPISAQRAPAAVAYVHGDSWRSADRCEQIAELFSLSSSEARIALALSRGLTISETAAEYGLAIETVRSHSKAIYAKTGARGLPDLVRIMMRSVLAFSP